MESALKNSRARTGCSTGPGSDGKGRPVYLLMTSYRVVVPLTSLPTTSIGLPLGYSSALMNSRPSGPKSPASDVSASTSKLALMMLEGTRKPEVEELDGTWEVLRRAGFASVAP
mgnify:CR=1 FL=1